MEDNNISTPAISLADTTAIVCPKCGCQVFDQGLLLRKISPVLIGTGQTGLVPVTVFACQKCSTVLEEFLPEELKGVYNPNEPVNKSEDGEKRSNILKLS
jgi:hypothetical protein